MLIYVDAKLNKKHSATVIVTIANRLGSNKILKNYFNFFVSSTVRHILNDKAITNIVATTNDTSKI